MNVLVTGGCGFIGSNLIRLMRTEHPDWRVLNFDALTYAGNLQNLADLEDDPGLFFVKGNVVDPAALAAVFSEHPVDVVFHLAAESHVDRSILGPAAFVRTNVLGTQAVLDTSRTAGVRRVVLVSTDEVYGSLSEDESPFTEDSPLLPSSPYSASKASGDLLAFAHHRTFGTDVIVMRCSNNYGPYQFPEKLVPLMVLHALEDAPLPVYGDGQNIRDWIHVEDHARALLLIAERGRAGATYNIGADCERRNLDLVKAILRIVGKPESLIRFVKDRPGHDRRYAIDSRRLKTELGWAPRRSFDTALVETVRWYQTHREWCETVRSGAYRDYYQTQYAARLGTGDPGPEPGADVPASPAHPPSASTANAGPGAKGQGTSS